ncbi:beta-ketoacyl synthase N-terminal-like domain-containing protein [Salinactinospora qingdaonensis]|uniref:Beta-ketoacyl synthase-like N-terminal domain-containing protein n=1 Tax=Salinactinospora qingdaonensis TaxID=702744 RepID=A0ABP7F946_9ACTN
MRGEPASVPSAPPAVATVTGWSVHLVGPVPEAVGDLEPVAGCTADDAREILGRKGLLYKEAATRLALCAVHRALDRPPRAPRPDGPPDPRTAVVASSNLGNTATVRSVMATVAATSGRDVSPLAAPNASSNVVASSVALWFRFGGPNLMLCSGAVSGLDAVAAAIRLLRTDRADRVVVVGVEPGDEVARAVHHSTPAAAAGFPLREGAACLILERGGSPAAGTPVVEPLATAPVTTAEGAPPVAVFGPCPPDWPLPPRVVGPKELEGDGYGAAGVVYTALAASLLAGGGTASAAVTCGDDVDGWRFARVRVAGEAHV